MKTKTITLKGWANTSDLLFSQNTNNNVFIGNFRALAARITADGYKQLNTAFDTLHGKKAVEKITVNGWYWKGAWSDPKKETYSVFYK